MDSRFCARVITIILCWILPVNLMAIRPLIAEQETASPHALYIVIDENQSPINNIKTRTAREVIVRVDDENHKPVAGALVTFTLPYNGPGGNFFEGGKVFQAVTDSQGRAVARGLYPNNVTGNFQIHVTASYSGQTGTAVIAQTNVLPLASPHIFLGMSAKTLAIVGSLAAAGAVGAGVAATRGGGTTITAGTPTVGAPR